MLPYPASSFSTGGECNPARDFKASFRAEPVIVSAHRDGNRLDIRVLDDGVGLPAGWTLENSGGVGLSVSGSGVAGFIPTEKNLFCRNRRASGGTEVEISLPLRWTGKGAHAAARV